MNLGGIPHGARVLWPDPAGADALRSVFAHDLVAEDDATSSGPVNVHGQIIDSVRAPDICLAGSGRAGDSVVANDRSVLGAVSGTISERNARLVRSAVVHADMSHERIAVEAGSEMEGWLQSKA